MTIDSFYGGNESHRWPSGTIDPRVVFAPHILRDVDSDERPLVEQQSRPCLGDLEDDTDDSVMQQSSTSGSISKPATLHSPSQKTDVLGPQCLSSSYNIRASTVHHLVQKAIGGSPACVLQKVHTCDQNPVAVSVIVSQYQSEHVFIQRSMSGRQPSNMSRPAISPAGLENIRIRAEKSHRHESRSTSSLSNHQARLNSTASVQAVPRQSGRPGGGRPHSYTFTCTFPDCLEKSSGQPRRFKRHEHKKRHERTVHTNEPAFQCWVPGCFASAFTRRDNLTYHLKSHGAHSQKRRNRYVATLDPHSRHYDPLWVGALTKQGRPIRKGLNPVQKRAS